MGTFEFWSLLFAGIAAFCAVAGLLWKSFKGSSSVTSDIKVSNSPDAKVAGRDLGSGTQGDETQEEGSSVKTKISIDDSSGAQASGRDVLK